MAKRSKFSRWRRLPGVYRFGEHKWPDPNQELQRISLYIPGTVLDRAEAQAGNHGFENVQDYCTELLLSAIEDERVRGVVADVEAKRGPFEGLHEIADDPEYLVELSAAQGSRDGITFIEPAPRELALPEPVSARSSDPVLAAGEISPAAQVVLRHAARAGDDLLGFLACLRRGEPVPPAELAELAQALHSLEVELRAAAVMDRRLIFSLHRLAFESQILHTDAWPGVFDHWTVDMLHAVQESVERILSGEDIRYLSSGPDAAGLSNPGQETPR